MNYQNFTLKMTKDHKLEITNKEYTIHKSDFPLKMRNITGCIMNVIFRGMATHRR